MDKAQDSAKENKAQSAALDDNAHFSAANSMDVINIDKEEEERKRFEQKLVENHRRRLSIDRSPEGRRISSLNHNMSEEQTPDDGQKRIRSPEEKEILEFEIIQKQMEAIQKVAKIYMIQQLVTQTLVEIKNGVRDLKKKWKEYK